MLGKEVTGDVEILYGLDWMLQWSQDKQSRPRVKCVRSGSFPQETSSSYLQETASFTSVTTGKLGMHVLAFFRPHQCTWIYRTAHTHRKHFPRFLALILGYMERKSTGVSFLQEVLTKVASLSEEGVCVLGLCSDCLLSSDIPCRWVSAESHIFTSDKFAKAQGGPARPRRGQSLMVL